MTTITRSMNDDDDICGLCGEGGADKIPHLVRWPGEQTPNTGVVHAECEQAECGRAHREFMARAGDSGVRDFLHNLK